MRMTIEVPDWIGDLMVPGLYPNQGPSSGQICSNGFRPRFLFKENVSFCCLFAIALIRTLALALAFLQVISDLRCILSRTVPYLVLIM
jgi:hypothetical protein